LAEIKHLLYQMAKKVRKFTKQELLEIVKKRTNRGLIKKKKIEKFGKIVIDSPIPYIGGTLGVLIGLAIAFVGNKKLMKITKNPTWNRALNFILNFLFGWILLPVRYFNRK